MSTIRAIDRADVHRICSGQVIVDLCAGVKELVENALDAKATRVEVRLMHFGFDSFEVVDDGTGIAAANRESVCLKHWTSKLKSFEDLSSVASFGFRGEALSSLCESASSLTITTRCAEDEHAVKLVYDRSGKLESSTVAARPVGTTVSVTNLFERLPVRRKDFEKNYKKHYSNLLYLMQAYAIVSAGVRISVTNHQRDGRKVVAIATQGADKMGPNLASVFGSKFLEELTPVDLSFTIAMPTKSKKEEPEVEDGGTTAETASSCSSSANVRPDLAVRFVGFVSNERSAGVGRSGTDRQFFFVNGRPADLKRFSKALNDVWRQYEMNHKPACALDLKLPPGSFDVNVTPDKREILIEREEQMIEMFKQALTAMWEPSKYTYQTSSSSQEMSSQRVDEMFKRVNDDQGSSRPSQRVDEMVKRGVQVNESSPMKATATKIKKSSSSLMTKFAMNNEEGLDEEDEAQTSSSAKANPKSTKVFVLDEEEGEEHTSKQVRQHHENTPARTSSDVNYQWKGGDESVPSSSAEVEAGASPPLSKPQVVPSSPPVATGDSRSPSQGEVVPCPHHADGDDSQVFEQPAHDDGHKDVLSSQESEDCATPLLTSRPDAITMVPPTAATACCGDHTHDDDDDAKEEVAIAKETPVGTRAATLVNLGGSARDFLALERAWNDAKRQRLSVEKTDVDSGPHFKALVQDDLVATAQLESVFSKSDFLRAEIIGQFNLGFIIARVNQDLFILDQHASDEKFRFETLQRSTTIQEQPLISPMPIELTPTEAQIVRDYEYVFNANGFHFANLNNSSDNDDVEVVGESETSQRLMLVRIPHSKQTTFGVEDVRELASILRDDPPCTMAGAPLPRLPKLRSMFASRACRSAIMIGDHLPPAQMARVVANLATLDQPWNCPHGRPTMRHLLHLPELCVNDKRDE